MKKEKYSEIIQKVKKEIEECKNAMRHITTDKVITHKGYSYEYWNLKFCQADSFLFGLKEGRESVIREIEIWLNSLERTTYSDAKEGINDGKGWLIKICDAKRLKDKLKEFRVV